jgi:hypothetical protein
MKRWPTKQEIEEAMNEYPVEMVHELADAAFARLEHRELVCLLASNVLRQPRVIRMVAEENLEVKNFV